MQDNIPRDDQTPLPPDEGASAATEPSGGSKGVAHFFDRVFRGGGQDQRESEPPPPDPEPRTQPEAPTWQPPASPQELDRLVQSRTDAELYRREQLRRERELSDLQQRADRAFEEGDDLLGGELTRQAKALQNGEGGEQQTAQLVGGISDFYDHLFLDSYLARLDAPAREALLTEPIVGAGGRALLSERIADALYAQGEAAGERKAEARLRKNPSFRKELLHEIRPGLEEPDHLPAVAASNSASMDDMIRQAVRR